MKTTFNPLRLADMSAGAPFVGLAWTLFGRQPGGQQDFVRSLAVVEGAGLLHRFLPGGEISTTPMRPGELYLLRPRDVFQFEGLGEAGMSGYVVSASLAFWNTFSNLIGLPASWFAAREPPRVTFELDDRRVIDPFERAVESFRTDPSMLDLLEFWVRIAPVMFRPRSHDEAKAPPWLSAGLGAMNLESNLVVGLPRLLELTRVTPSHLSRTVLRYYGLTPSRLLLDLRLHHAGVLLTTTSDSIGTIARRCGFADASYFTMCFRRAMLVTPRDYRIQHLGGLAGSFDSPDRTRPWSSEEYYASHYVNGAAPRPTIRTALRWDDPLGLPDE